MDGLCDDRPTRRAESDEHGDVLSRNTGADREPGDQFHEGRVPFNPPGWGPHSSTPGWCPDACPEEAEIGERVASRGEFPIQTARQCGAANPLRRSHRPKRSRRARASLREARAWSADSATARGCDRPQPPSVAAWLPAIAVPACRSRYGVLRRSPEAHGIEVDPLQLDKQVDESTAPCDTHPKRTFAIAPSVHAVPSLARDVPPLITVSQRHPCVRSVRAETLDGSGR
jgi:hypothetical protein